MSAGRMILCGVALWFVVGFATLGLVSRRHPDWYNIGYHLDPDVVSAGITVIGWPMVALAALASEMLPPESK